jgi:hypothetical protein
MFWTDDIAKGKTARLNCQAVTLSLGQRLPFPDGLQWEFSADHCVIRTDQRRI